jgi:hypothetical protein
MEFDETDQHKGEVRVVSHDNGVELRFRLPEHVVADSPVLTGLAESPGEACLYQDPADVFKWLGFTLSAGCNTNQDLAASLRVASFLGARSTRAAAASELCKLLLLEKPGKRDDNEEHRKRARDSYLSEVRAHPRACASETLLG